MDTSIGERIKAVRGALTQSDFAKSLGVHKNSLSRYERGVGSPDAQFIQALCTKYEIAPAWLLFGDPNMDGNRLQAAPVTGSSSETCPNCAQLQAELAKERDMSRELVSENRRLWKDNGDLREQLADLKARAAPSKEEPPEAAQDCA